MNKDTKNFLSIVLIFVISLLLQKLIFLLCDNFIHFSTLFKYRFIRDKIIGFSWIFLFCLFLFIDKKLNLINLKESLKISTFISKRNYLIFIFYSISFSILFILSYLLIIDLAYTFFKFNLIDSSIPLNLNNLIFNTKQRFNIGLFDYVYKDFFIMKNGYIYLIIELIYVLLIVLIEEFVFRYLQFKYEFYKVNNPNYAIWDNCFISIAFIIWITSKQFLFPIFILYTYFLLSKSYFYTKSIKITIINHYIFELGTYFLPFAFLKFKTNKIIIQKYGLMILIVFILLDIVLIFAYNKFIRNNFQEKIKENMDFT